MIGNAKVITALQSAITLEAQLNLQYRLDWRAAKFMGTKKIAKKLNSFGDGAHCFMKKVTDRALFLGGTPSYAPGAVKQAATITETFKNELALEMGIVQPYEDAVRVATEALDDTSRNLFEHLLKWHERHVGWLEQQLRLIDGLGEPEYIAENI